MLTVISPKPVSDYRWKQMQTILCGLLAYSCQVSFYILPTAWSRSCPNVDGCINPQTAMLLRVLR